MSFEHMLNNMKKTLHISKTSSGFSLAEVLTALMIGAVVLVAVLNIYGRYESAAAAITQKLDSSRLASEILQRIAEDLDQIIAEDHKRRTATGAGTKITIENKYANGLPVARLTIRKTIYDRLDKTKLFEEIIWQAVYNHDSPTRELILYRSHKGLAGEDKLLDEQKSDWEKELFVPFCEGLTIFKVQVPKDEGEDEDEELQDKWTGPSLPYGVVVTISFAEPYKTISGTFDVPETKKISRTIAINRTRKINFQIIKEDDEHQTQQQQEPPDDQPKIDE
jgi:prepilin-type N-terminal cleavage/methylation domain-containing protein